MYCYHPKIFRGKEREWLLKPGRKGDDQALEREGCVEGTTLRSTIILDWRSQPVQVHPAERRLGNIYPQPHSPSRHSPTVALHWLNPDSSQRAREITGSVWIHLQCERSGSIPGLGRSPGEGMATHSSILAWRIPWAGEPSGLQSMGSQRVEHNWRDLACTHRKWVVCNKWSKLLLQVSINRWTDKENVIYTCNGMVFNLKKGMNCDMLQHEWTLKIC